MTNLIKIDGAEPSRKFVAIAYLITEDSDMRVLWKSRPAGEVFQSAEDAETLGAFACRTVYAGDDFFSFPISLPIVIEVREATNED